MHPRHCSCNKSRGTSFQGVHQTSALLSDSDIELHLPCSLGTIRLRVPCLLAAQINGLQHAYSILLTSILVGTSTELVASGAWHSLIEPHVNIEQAVRTRVLSKPSLDSHLPCGKLPADKSWNTAKDALPRRSCIRSRRQTLSTWTCQVQLLARLSIGPTSAERATIDPSRLN